MSRALSTFCTVLYTIFYAKINSQLRLHHTKRHCLCLHRVCLGTMQLKYYEWNIVILPSFRFSHVFICFKTFIRRRFSNVSSTKHLEDCILPMKKKRIETQTKIQLFLYAICFWVCLTMIQSAWSTSITNILAKSSMQITETEIVHSHVAVNSINENSNLH